MDFDSHKEPGRVVELVDGKTRVGVDLMGCRIVRYQTDGLSWLRAADAVCPGTFPMIPFASRIRKSKFTFHNHRVALPANNPPEAHAIHGHAWQREWRVLERSAHKAVLTYRHDGQYWPWRYHAVVSFTLSGMHLDLEMCVTNDAEDKMPWGIGWHPYFPVTRGCRVTTAVTHRWCLDDELFPTHKVVSPRQLFSPGEENLDAVFAGWNRLVTIQWPERRATLRMQAGRLFDYFVVYSPGADFFCAEPVSNLPDAFNAYASGADEHGTLVLAPEATASASLSFKPEIGAGE